MMEPKKTSTFSGTLRVAAAAGVFTALCGILFYTLLIKKIDNKPFPDYSAMTNKEPFKLKGKVDVSSEEETLIENTPQENEEIAVASSEDEQYTLEIAAFATEEEARSEVEHLAGEGLDSYFTPYNSGGQVIYRVRRGFYPTKALAEKAAKEFRTSANRAATVTKL